MQQLTEAQKLWVAALRSGKYNQAAGKLQDETGYCCLGVACKVADETGVSVRYEDGMLCGKNLSEQQEVFDWLNLRTYNGGIKEVSTGDFDDCLTYFNDKRIYTFEELADYIEENAEKLFK